MPWYEFNQNNSGGGFDVDDDVCHRLFIEADSVGEACNVAKSKGVYFNGVDDGIDCECCGDRWHVPYDEERFPMNYGRGVIFNTVEEYAQHVANEYGWTSPDTRIFYKSGEVKEIFTQRR